MRIRSLVPVCLLLFVSLVWSQSRPNFEGCWVLNSQRSIFVTGQPKPSSVELAIAHHAGVIETEWQVKSAAENVRLKLRFTTDGNPTTNRDTNQRAFETLTPVQQDGSFGGIEMSSKWEGGELKVRSIWYRPDKRSFELDDTWKLSADKKTLTIDRTSGPQHSSSAVDTVETHIVLVFERSTARH